MIKAIVVALILAFGAAQADTTIEIGQGWASGDPGNAAVILGQRNEKYGIALGVIETNYIQSDGLRQTLGRNMFVDVMRFWQTPQKRWEFGIGPSYFQNTNRALTKKLNFSLLLRFNINQDVSIVVRHWSNFGTDYYNMGQDFIGVGFRF